MDKYKMEELFANTVFLVEATSSERYTLWQNHSVEGASKNADVGHRMAWVHLETLLKEIGSLDGRPVMLLLSWVMVEGRLVCFHESTSELVDHAMIGSFLKEKFVNVGRCDVMNFHCAVDHIISLRQEPLTVLKESGYVLGRAAVEDFRAKGIITTKMVELAALAKDKREPGALEIEAAIRGLKDIAQTFRDQVWREWLKRDLEALSTNGASAEANGISMHALQSAGRIMVTLRRAAQEVPYLSLLGHVGGWDGLRFRGCWGNYDELACLVRGALTVSDALRAALRPDEVWLAG